MSSVSIQGNASGTGIFTIASPNSNTNRTLTLPDNTGTILTGSSAITASQLPAGSVLQVVSTTKTDTFTTTSGTYVDITGMSVSITPSNNANKILILVNLAIINSSASTRYVFKLVRNSTDIGSGTGAGTRVGVMAGDQTTAATGGFLGTMGGIHLDSPATTSATTYKVQTYAIDSGTIIVNRTMNDTDGSSYFRTSSSITAMEIAA